MTFVKISCIGVGLAFAERFNALRAKQSPLLLRKAVFFRKSGGHGRPLQIWVFAGSLGQVIMTAKEFSRSGHCRGFIADRTGFHAHYLQIFVIRNNSDAVICD